MTTTPAASRPTILVVEDNPITRKMIRIALESEGYAVMEADSGEAALQLAAGQRPDLVVQDYVLPDMDGLQLLTEIRKQPDRTSVPVLVLTGMVSRIEELRTHADDATVFLAKPLEPSRLIEIVRTHLAGKPEAVGRGRRVLVVDDEQLNQKLAALSLRAAGFEVETASGAEEALERARRSPPDAILSDVLMPGTDGFLLCRALRADARLSRVPVVLVSSEYVEEQDWSLGREMGANAFVLRTPDLGEAISALMESLGKRAPPPPQARDEDLDARHKERLQVQLDRQIARNQALLREAAIQAAALSVARGLRESLAQPRDVRGVLGDVLVHCLDAAGLSTGVLYLVEESGLHLRAVTGLAAGSRPAAEECFGHTELLRRILASGEPVAFVAGSTHDDAGREVASRLGHSSVLIVPFVVLGEPVAVLLLASDSHDLSARSWIGFARALAAQFGQAIAFGQSAARLAASEERYRGIFENAVVGIFQTTLDGRYVTANPTLARIYGYESPEELIASLTDLNRQFYVQPGRREEFARLVEERGAVREFESQVYRKDGGVIWISEAARAVRDAEGRLVGFEGTTVDITGRKLAEEERERLAAILEATTDFVGIADPQGRVLFLNRAGRKVLGMGPDEDVSRLQMAEGHSGWARKVSLETGIPAAVRDGVWTGETAFLDGKGREVPFSQVILAHKGPDGQVAFISTIARDLSEQKNLEAQLRQAQKMEAIGQLAGGVAHDFNNLLGVIGGYGELLLKDIGPQHPARGRAEQILKATDRAAALTRQLLVFSRKQVLQPRLLDLNAVLANIGKMLRRLIGEDIELVTVFKEGLWRTMADPGQIEQVIVNLAVNARDAMPGGGKLVLETANEELDEGYARSHAGARPGPHVMLAVSDTGHGMDAETLGHIFEPFFTTKEPGKGTGLGLATVYGIVRQSGGHVNVYSEPGRGSSFKVYLPRAESESAVAAPVPVSGTATLGGTETILLAEDEEALRVMVREILETAGYTVLGGARPDEVLTVARSHAAAIHLVLTDVVMPGMSGRELATQLQAAHPGVRVLYMSGYTNGAINHHEVLDAGVAFIQKPFTHDSLLRKVREALDAPGR